MKVAKTLSIALAGLAAWLLPAAVAPAAEPAPAWSIVASAFPTDFSAGTSGVVEDEEVKGPIYFLRATNIGGAPTTGTYTISATLPAGVTPLAGTQAKGGKSESNLEGTELSCQTVGQTVSCSGDEPINPSEGIARAWIPVAVDPSPPASVVAEASIEGGGAGQSVSTATEIALDGSDAPFDFLKGNDGLSAFATAADGAIATQAGSHPYQLTVGTGFPRVTTASRLFTSGSGVKDISVDLPHGVVVNPEATPVLCTEAQLADNSVGCPIASQVGAMTVLVVKGSIQIWDHAPIYNMVPSQGKPAVLALKVIGDVVVHLEGRVRSDGDYGLSADVNDIVAKLSLADSGATLWGNPTDASHDTQRGSCLKFGTGADTCPTERLDTAFLTMPSECNGEPTTTRAKTDSWEKIGDFRETSFESATVDGTPVSISGCNQLEFEPTIEAQPTTSLADSPTGLNFNLHQPQSLDYEGLSNAHLKDTTVKLPEGMAVNPSSADGLGACSTSEVGLTTGIGQKPIRFTAEPANCPNASKLGSVQVKTPLLADPLPGAVYLAEPYQNPFGSLLAIYLTVHDEERGVVAKLAGKVTPDPQTGQLTARFEENPQLPLEDVDVSFFGGPRASLRTPPTCATYTTVADLTPWSAPEGEDAHPEDSFAIQANPGGGSCPTSEGNAPHVPSFSAGTIDPVAGAYSPFVLKVSRADATQELSAIEATLPPGLSAKLAGTSYCPESAIAQAKQREQPNQGSLELSNPSCPSASQVGTVDVAAGAGITPLHVSGKAYLAGPYKGAPLSLAVITPAVAGPFDLGAVVVRTALQVDSKTAQVKATSDPLPTIIEGIPLDVRSITVDASKPQFSLNPTSCDPMEVGGSATSALNQTAPLKSPFQVGGCKALPFKPKIQIKLKGKTNRGAHPALTATATFTQGHANTKRAAVTLPRSAFLDQGHIRTVCTRVQFQADQCPKAAIYGFARAFTPLLDKPLEGPVYLRSSNNELPDLVADLKGQVDFELIGRVDSVNGGIRNTFEAAPDAPVSRFVLKMQGGSKGLLQNSENLCRASKEKRRATVKLDGHNGKVWDFRPVVKNECGKKARRGKGRGR